MALSFLVPIDGCKSITGQTTKQYVDEKAKLVGDKVANLTRVDVDTTNKVVSLNGVVESPDQKTRAEQLAMQVNGVSRVEIHLQVQRKTN
jgi:osmotically-inducible protein OsmY